MERTVQRLFCEPIDTNGFALIPLRFDGRSGGEGREGSGGAGSREGAEGKGRDEEEGDA